MSILQILKSLAQRHHPGLRAGRALVGAAGTLASGVASAQLGGGLSDTTSMLTQIKSQLYVIVPIVAVIGGLVIFVLYMNNVLHKEIAVRWFLGLILISMVAEIVALAIHQ
ncbi:TrbC/VirB2 family protein [Castellaniella sp. UC4442_H9]